MISRARGFSLRLLALAVLLTLVLAPRAYADVSNTPKPYDPVVHIELARFFAGAAKVSISCDTALSANDAQGKPLLTASAGDRIDASLDRDGKLILSPALSASDSEASQAGEDETPSAAPITIATISSASDAGILSIALPGNPPRWHRYRGVITLTVAAGHLRMINVIPLEEYLCGVLKPEIGASAPTEALKAQAVAARTYAVRNLGHLASEGADLDDTTRTQSYLGVDGETPAICDAVRATEGLVMTFQGLPIEAVYSTDCGGETAPGGPGEPYLQPVSDPDCASKPSWTKIYSRQVLQQALSKSPQTSVDELKSLSIEATDASGRASNVLISGEDGNTKEVTGAQLRLELGTDVLRSTMFTVKQLPDGTFVFTGHGWGHGMGMCQQGAIALAQGTEPQHYDKILKHYYTGIGIVPLTSDLVAAVTELGKGKTQSHEISSSAVSSGGKS